MPVPSPAARSSSLALCAFALLLGCHHGGGGQPPAPEGSPAAPSNLRNAEGGWPVYQVVLHWDDNSADEQGFVLRTRVGDGDWSESELPADTITTSTTAPRGTRVTYAVCAYNAQGRSWWSNEVSVDVPQYSGGGRSCALILDPGEPGTADPDADDDGGDGDDGGIDSPCVWLCAVEEPTVFDRTRDFGSPRPETLRSTRDNFTVDVLGGHTARDGFVRYDLELAVFPGDAPIGTTSDACLMMHDPAHGDLRTVLATVGYGHRPSARPWPQGTAMPLRAGQRVPVTATVDIGRATWSVAAFGLEIVRDAPLDAIVTVPLVYVGR